MLKELLCFKNLIFELGESLCSSRGEVLSNRGILIDEEESWEGLIVELSLEN